MKFYELISKVITKNVNIAFKEPVETADLVMNVVRIMNGLKTKVYEIN